MLLLVSILFSGYAFFRNEKPELTVNKKAQITGTVSVKPKKQVDKNRTTLMLSNVTLDGESIEDEMYVYLYGSTDNSLQYGQKLTFDASGCWIPDGQTNPNGFDFRQYLWMNGVSVCASVSLSDVEIEDGSFSLKRALYALSDRLSEKIDRLFPENSDVMNALLLGNRTFLSDETYENFRISGIAHLVALSGLHVSCLALLMDKLLLVFFLPRRVRSILTLAALSLYALMTGASPSVLRALFMYGYFVLAREAGYYPDLLTRLSFACLLQLLINPLMLQDGGMQMSYLSVLSLLLIAKAVRSFQISSEGRTLGERLTRLLGDSAAGSFAIQLGTLPIAATQFHSIAVLSVPVNLIAIPLGLFTVYAGAAALLTSFLYFPVGKLIALPCEWIWSVIKYFSSEASSIPFAALNARAWNVWAVLVFFLLLAAASPYLVKSLNIRKSVCAIVSAFALVIMLWPAPEWAGLTMVFLDAGYADSCVLHSGRVAYVVDTGKDNGISADYLTASGTHVAGVFLTHPDIDHAGGAKEILMRYPWAKVYVSECWDRMEISEETEKALSKADVTYLSAGDVLLFDDGVTFEVLWPYEGYEPSNDNDGSLVLKVSYREKSAVFMGDLTDEEDENITADGDILKVSHHGSKYATTGALLENVTPGIAVISVASNGYGHPTEEVLERLDAVGARVYRTDECGAITIKIGEDGEMTISTMLSGGRENS